MSLLLDTPEKVLDFAIQREIEAEAFYRDLVQIVTQPGMRDILLEFAEEERWHQERLQKVQEGQTELISSKKPFPAFRPNDINASHHDSTKMTLSDALTLAMHREKQSYRLYLTLAAETDFPELMDLCPSVPL